MFGEIAVILLLVLVIGNLLFNENRDLFAMIVNIIRTFIGIMIIIILIKGAWLIIIA